ncbi:ADP-ribosylglycohydrolase family protein [Hymenobacter elongatus]|uniref:ADP-ribosylglycohydrolase family protein n=1 Tax=Hymenobacter elongatus TaxID=877208 RepID=A0A4Z0PR40_9BACT|nr:ADP-ribosylglycohydrolase family protein [Hymenobacter elongatus]TGE20180.1 hypothetical protein E5J99_01015 [Hymenobacter elongatus]
MLAAFLGGAIGDACGSSYEQTAPEQPQASTYYPFGKPVAKHYWAITNDTQLTLATCEAIAQKFLVYYRARRLTGLGGSTCNALHELEAGGHWSQVGRQGQYGAGNGVAMRIAPLAFVSDPVLRQTVEEVYQLTYQHPEV